MNKLTSLITIALTVVTSAFGQVGQLYLISGGPTPKYDIGYSTSLVAVGTDGSVKTIQEIVPGKFGTEWTAVSYDARVALILSKSPDNRVIVFNFDSASVVKSCEHPDGTSLVGQWLVDSPSRGLMFAGFGTSKLTQKDQLLGMVMDAAVPCQNSFGKLDSSELKYVVSHGFAGVADMAGHDAIDLSLGSDGSVSRRWLTGEQTYFDYKVPSILFNDMKHPSATMLINNQQILGLTLRESSNSRFLVLRKSDNTWHHVPEPSVGRGFGSFIGSSEAHMARVGMPGSAGKAEWRQEETPTGPSTAGRLGAHPAVYPGVLHLYDAATERSYTITTNQGDSEILLVESNTVYYRVSNRLYSAPILTTTIGAPQLLATDELIRDAHWAFISRR